LANHPNRSKTCRPREILRSWGRSHDGIWRIVDDVRQSRCRDDPAWPDHVYLPLERAGEAMARWAAAHDVRMRIPGDLVRPASELATLAAWRVSQGVYRFDETLYDAILETPIEGEIPAEMLVRLPEWCVYIETPGLDAPLLGGGTTQIRGVFAWLDRVRDDLADVLTLAMDADGAGLAIGHVPLVGTLEEALARVEEDWQDALARGNATEWHAGYSEAARPLFGRILSLLLYLCSERPDVAGGWPPERPRAKRTKRGWRLFPADKPRTWEVGVRLGAALRRGHENASGEDACQGAQRRAPRPHIRRAHWHTYRVGKCRSDRVLRWLPPIPVNVDDIDDLPATVHEVME